MLLVKKIILNYILVVFPLIIYLIFINNVDNLNNKIKDKIFFIMLVFILLFLSNYNLINSKYIIFFYDIPVILSYVKGNYKLSLLISFLNICTSNIYCNDLLLTFLYKYITYFLIYINYKNCKQNLIKNILIYQLINIFIIYFGRIKLFNIKYILIFSLILYIYFYSLIFILVLIDNNCIKKNNLKDLLEKNQKEKEFLFKLTHEIKNPLAVCKGYIDIIERNNSSKYVEIMKNEIERSLNIINDYSEYSKIKLEKEEIDINLLLEEVYETFDYLYNSNIKIKYTEYKDDLYIEADYNKLKEVLINLVKNSVEAIKDKGLIELETNQINNIIEITIKDNGIGMDDYTKNNVNKMFYTTKSNGTGIGVAYSNEIIKLHNGELIYNSILNKGTTTIIKLPVN